MKSLDQLILQLTFKRASKLL